MRICLSYVFFFEFGKLQGIGYTGKNGKRIFQCLADGTLNVVVCGASVAMAVQHVAKASNNATRRIGKRIVEIKEVGCIIHKFFCGRSYE